MSLPLPVFRLDLHADLPFEPLSALEPAGDAAAEPRFLFRLQQWFARPGTSLADDVEGG